MGLEQADEKWLRRGCTMSTLAHLEPGSESITNFDRLIRARIGKQSLGLSPPGLMLVYLDWLVHLEFSPAKRLELLGIGLRGALRLALYAARSLADPGTPAHRGVGARGIAASSIQSGTGGLSISTSNPSS